MDRKEEFRASLAKLRELAEQKYNHVTIADILSCFPGRELTREEIALIHTYAEEEHIVIEDYRPRDTRTVQVGKAKLTGTEKATFQMYLKEVARVKPLGEEEAEYLAERFSYGETELLERLTEGHLHLVLDLAQVHAGQGVLIGDLVQEGNVELFLALSELAEGKSLLAGGLREYLRGRVDTAMKRAVAEHTGHVRAGEKIAREANRLLAATMDFEEENGREASLSELSEMVGLPEDSVKELIQISLDAAALGDRADQEGTEGTSGDNR